MVMIIIMIMMKTTRANRQCKTVWTSWRKDSIYTNDPNSKYSNMKMQVQHLLYYY
jgi:cobalamin biosynthesis protein CobD/CbiB